MKHLLFLLTTLLLAWAVLSCRTVYVPVTSSSDSSSVTVLTRIDSVRYEVRDSVYIKEAGDTVLVERWKTVVREKITAKTDTVTVKVTEIKEIPVEVEKKLTAWQTLRLEASGWMAAALLLIIVLAVFKNKLKTFKLWRTLE